MVAAVANAVQLAKYRRTADRIEVAAGRRLEQVSVDGVQLKELVGRLIQEMRSRGGDRRRGTNGR